MQRKLTLIGQSARITCPCGADYSAIVQDIREREARPQHEVTHPWRYDAKEQTQQHLRDEAAYPEGSPWRYNDVTLRNPNNV